MLPNLSFRATSYGAFVLQCQYLDQLAEIEIPSQAMPVEEIAERERFRERLEDICRSTFHSAFPFVQHRINLQLYGSIQSGLAIKGSDMDTLVVARLDALPAGEFERLPRLFEKALLDIGYGARLLTNTRVPILKICEKPSSELLTRLIGLRETWEEKDQKSSEEVHPDLKTQNLQEQVGSNSSDTGSRRSSDPDSTQESEAKDDTSAPAGESQTTIAEKNSNAPAATPVATQWLRERAPGAYDFPKHGVGIQCDIGFSRRLGIFNTQLLRCYNACDPRVRQMILFVKIWAKRRKINSSYHGTLSSYGWSLFVLHFLINVVTPPVLPNLQTNFGPQPTRIVDGRAISFMDNYDELSRLAAAKKITWNTEPLGTLLRNFFLYYGRRGPDSFKGGFRWMEDIIAIRVKGGLLPKQAKGWVSAKSTMVDGVEVRNRYLVAVECPLETDHNVGRTVTHHGMVAIRDEFRRACRILERIGGRQPLTEGLLDELAEVGETAGAASR